MLAITTASARRRPRFGGFVFSLPLDGWAYRNVASNDTADYSGASVDTSAWDIGSEPFASSYAHPYAQSAGFPYGTGVTWPLLTRMWARRSFVLPRALDVPVRVFVDDNATVWVNGVLVLPKTTNDSGSTGADSFIHAFVIPASVLVAGTNVIALLAEDLGVYTYACFDPTPATLY